MRRHHTGSGRRPAVPVDWGSHHGTVVEKIWQTEAVIDLRKPGGTSGWNEALGRTATTPFPPFAGNVPASLNPITAGEVNAVEEREWVLGYRVAVPLDASPTPDQLDEGIEIIVRSCSDPMLVGVTMRVSEVERGTHLFQRVLIAQVNS